jgi:hypothetical protein
MTKSFKKEGAQPKGLPGLNICILQTRLERYSADRLNTAMQAAWNRPYDESNFFGINLDDEHGLIKAIGMFIPVYYHDRRLDNRELDNAAIPTWATHTSFCQVSFVTGDGLKTTEDRRKFVGFISLLCIELANEATTSFFFIEDAAFVAKDRLTKQAIFEQKPFDPRSIASS